MISQDHIALSESAKSERAIIQASLQAEVDRRCYEEGYMRGLTGVTGTEYIYESRAYNYFQAGWSQGFEERKLVKQQREMVAQVRELTRKEKQKRNKANREARAE